MLCAHCGRPAASLVWINGMGYHAECTHGPGGPLHYAQMPPNPGAVPWRALAEADVRRIVQDEMQRAGLLNSPNA